jgi:hypothetical protein
LDDVIAALASNCEDLTNIDYALFAEEAVADCGLSLHQMDGATPHCKANCWHRVIVQVTAKKLVALAKAIYDNRQQVERRGEKEIQRLLLAAVSDGYIDVSRLKGRLRNKLHQ